MQLNSPEPQSPLGLTFKSSQTQLVAGQNVLMVMWIDKPPPTANGILGDRWIDMTIEIAKPDGSKETLGPFQSDDAGGYTATYTLRSN